MDTTEKHGTAKDLVFCCNTVQILFFDQTHLAEFMKIMLSSVTNLME